jgi:hypothetical protein
MEDRTRTQFLSVVVLAVVFAAGGLVGAAVVRSDGSTYPATVAVPAPEREVSAGEAETEREPRDRRFMFEQAGATEEQAAYIRREIFPWYRNAIDEIERDSTFLALDARADSVRDEARAAWRELEAYYHPRRDALQDSARKLIREVLDPAAQVAYDSILAERSRHDRDRDDDDRGRRP